MITKLRPTFTFDQERVDVLKAIAPEAFVDGKINWDVLHEARVIAWKMRDVTPSTSGCSGPGKREARQMATAPSTRALQLASGDGINEEIHVQRFR